MKLAGDDNWNDDKSWINSTSVSPCKYYNCRHPVVHYRTIMENGKKIREVIYRETPYRKKDLPKKLYCPECGRRHYFNWPKKEWEDPK